MSSLKVLEDNLKEEEEHMDAKLEVYSSRIQDLMNSFDKKEENFLYLNKKDLDDSMKFLQEPTGTVLVVQGQKATEINMTEDPSTKVSWLNFTSKGKELKATFLK